MKTKFEQLIDDAKAVRLTAIEKRDFRRKLLEYIQMRPIRNEDSYRLPLVETAPARTMRASRFSILSLRVVTPAVLIVLIAGGGVSWGAEGSLPGDVLYPVKVVVNEEIVARLAPTPKSKASWETKRAERRLIEAEQLAMDGKLDSATQAEVTTRLETHLSSAADKIKEIGADPEKMAAANDLSTRLESKLRIHTQVLSELEGSEGEEGVGTGMASAVAAQAQTVAEVRAESNQKSLADGTKTKQAALDQKESSLKAKKELKDLLDSNKNADLDIKDAVGQQLVRIQEVEDSALLKFEAADYNGAFTDFQKAVSMAEEVKALFGIKKNLDINITIVPSPELDPGDDISTSTVEATTTTSLQATSSSDQTASTTISASSSQAIQVKTPVKVNISL